MTSYVEEYLKTNEKFAFEGSMKTKQRKTKEQIKEGQKKELGDSNQK
jgi:hypothetical protein